MDGERERAQITVAEATADVDRLRRGASGTLGVAIHDQLLESHGDKERAVLGALLLVLEQR